MMQSSPLSNDPTYYAAKSDVPAHESATSGVAWAAIIGGAVAMTAVTLILMPLGSALGLAVASPWNRIDEPAKAFSITTGIWMVLVQWLSAALGGYLTGRLRAKWVGAHTHEVFFRDTVHGFMSWALATVTGAILIASMATHLAAGMPGDMAKTMYTDQLFRSERGPTTISEQDRVEASHLLMKAETSGTMADNDRVYLIHMVEDRTGLSQADAQVRVDSIITQDKIAVDKARKAAASVAFILSLSMLIGAFVASVAGALGGRDRDIHYPTGKFFE